jgi:hypothetical protein
MHRPDARKSLWIVVVLHNAGSVALATTVLRAYGQPQLPPVKPTADERPITIDYHAQILETATPIIQG